MDKRSATGDFSPSFVAVHTPEVNYVHYNSTKGYFRRTCDARLFVDLMACASNQGISDCCKFQFCRHFRCDSERNSPPGCERLPRMKQTPGSSSGIWNSGIWNSEIDRPRADQLE